MARQQPELQANGRQGDVQGELQVQRTADLTPRNIDTHEVVTRDTLRERSVGELFRDLTNETSDLVSKEIALVKAEARQTGATLARDGAKVGTAVGLAFAGVLALTAFLIAGLGDLLDGTYWLSSLIVGVLFFAIGGGLVRNATAEIKRRAQEVRHTVESLKDTGSWAKEEAQQVKQELTR
jgi:hypothetical protein